MTRSTLIALIVSALLLLAAPMAQAAPCLLVTITGAQGGPQTYKGQAGSGTLISYGDDADNCGTVWLQFDAGRGTLLRLSEIGVESGQLNAIFFTHMHNDHSEGFIDRQPWRIAILVMSQNLHRTTRCPSIEGIV